VGELLLEVLGDGVDERLRLDKVTRLDLVDRPADAERKVLGHDATLDSVDARTLELLAEVSELLVVVELCTVGKTARPGEDRGNGVGRGGLTLLVLAEVASDSAVGSLRLDGLAVRADEDRGHETEGTVTLSDAVGLDITIVVLASPDEAAVALDHVGDHVVDETVLVDDAGGLVLVLELLVVDLLEDVLEAAVVDLEDGVLGGEEEVALLGETHKKGAAGKVRDGGISVEHGKSNTRALEVVHGHADDLTTLLGSVDKLDLASLRNTHLSGLVLVSVRMTADGDGLGPLGHKTRNILHDDGLTENSAAKDVADGAVGALVHALEVELLHTSLIRSDGRTLDADIALLDGIRGLHSDLVVSSITVGDVKIKVADRKVKEGKNELVLDHLPDDTGHLITVKLNNRVLHNNLGHVSKQLY